MIIYILLIILILAILFAIWKYKLIDLSGRKFFGKKDVITSSIDDVFPYFMNIENYPPQPVSQKIMDKLAKDGKVALDPGIYDFYLQSFCLDTGKCGPSSDSVYLIAPFEGKQSNIIQNILDRSIRHPEISQQNIQTLIWAITSDVQYSDMSGNLQRIADQLLAKEDLKQLRKSFLNKIPQPVKDWLLKELKKRLPSQILSFWSTADKMKQKIADAQTTYKELERVAVRFGKPKKSKTMPEVGTWSLAHGSKQFFMRVFPSDYKRSRIQIYVPDPKSWTKLADKIAKKYEIDPAVLKAVVEAETNGRNIKGDYSKGEYHAFGYGQVWPELHEWMFLKAMRDAGLEISQDKAKDFQYLGEQILQNNAVSMDVAALAVKMYWEKTGKMDDFSDEHYKKFTRKYVGSNISSKDMKRRCDIWEEWKDELGGKEDNTGNGGSNTGNGKGNTGNEGSNKTNGRTNKAHGGQINFNPGSHIGIPVNPDWQRIGFRCWGWSNWKTTTPRG